VARPPTEEEGKEDADDAVATKFGVVDEDEVKYAGAYCCR